MKTANRDTLAVFSQDFVWDFVHQLLLLSKPNAILDWSFSGIWYRQG